MAKRRASKNAKNPLAEVSKADRHLIVIVGIILVVLLLFAIEPGFFLGLLLGIIGYHYYTHNFIKTIEKK